MTLRMDAAPLFWDSSAQFGAYLRRIRIERRLTSRAAADLLGFSQAYVSTLENKSWTGPPSSKLIRTVAERYGLDLQEVIRESGYRFPAVPTFELDLNTDAAFDRLMANVRLRPADYEIQQAHSIAPMVKRQILDLVLLVAREVRAGFDIESFLRGDSTATGSQDGTAMGPQPPCPTCSGSGKDGGTFCRRCSGSGVAP